MGAIKSRLFMIAVIKEANKIWGYRIIDRVSKELLHVQKRNLKADTSTHSVYYVKNNEFYAIENLHSYKTEAGILLKGGASGQTSKYPVINQRGQLINDINKSVRITLLASYKDKYKYSDYKGRIKYLTAQEVYYAVQQGSYILTNSKVVVKNGKAPIISLLYGTLPKEEVLAKTENKITPTSNIKKVVQGDRQAKLPMVDKSSLQVLHDVPSDALVEAINYVKSKLEAGGMVLEDIDCIGIALIYCKVYTVQELKNKETFEQVHNVIKRCIENDVHFANLVEKMDSIMYTP